MNEHAEDIITYIINDNHLNELWEGAVLDPNKEDALFEDLIDQMPDITDEELDLVTEEIWTIRNNMPVPDHLSNIEEDGEEW